VADQVGSVCLSYTHSGFGLMVEKSVTLSSLPGFGGRFSSATFTTGPPAASYSTICAGLNLLCGCFVRSFAYFVESGSTEETTTLNCKYTAKVESKCSSKIYLVELRATSNSAAFEEVKCTCLTDKSVSLCCHATAVLWAIMSIKNGWEDYPKISGKSFNPNYARIPLQRFEVFAELLPIVPWESLVESLFHEEPIQGGSVSVLKTIRKQATKKGFGWQKQKKIDPNKPFDHYTVPQLKEIFEGKWFETLRKQA
jgi:hypothetical protein